MKTANLKKSKKSTFNSKRCYILVATAIVAASGLFSSFRNVQKSTSTTSKQSNIRKNTQDIGNRVVIENTVVNDNVNVNENNPNAIMSNDLEGFKAESVPILSDADEIKLANLAKNICTDEELTVKCVCGADTHPEYLKNMFETYAQSRHDSSLFEKCLNLTLPFNSLTPLECWPKIYILPSYPTSGNELARSILQKAVKRNVFLSEYKEPGGRTGTNDQLFILKAAGNALRVKTNNCGNEEDYQRSMPFPMMGKAGIYKTHGPTRWGIDTINREMTNDPNLGGFSTGGIVHLARNPGDHLLRNNFRWTNRKNGCTSNHECFLMHGHEFCDTAVESGENWSNWHNFWFEKSLTTPHIIYHYENFSSMANVTQSTEKVMDFLNESPPPSTANYSLHDELSEVVKEPSYEYGTLMAQVCGKDKARVLHEATKEVSEKLGYVFDKDLATWSLA